MQCSLESVVDAFASGLRAVDASGVAHKAFQPGVGPYGEADAVRAALERMRSDSRFADARTKRLPDMLIPGQWALEFKIIRPFGDNGLPAEHWSENILHPYPGNTSSLGDCLKLIMSGLPEHKGIIVFGYEHAKAVVPLDSAIRSFELLAHHILQIQLSPVWRGALTVSFIQCIRFCEYSVGRFSMKRTSSNHMRKLTASRRTTRLCMVQPVNSPPRAPSLAAAHLFLVRRILRCDHGC